MVPQEAMDVFIQNKKQGQPLPAHGQPQLLYTWIHPLNPIIASIPAKGFKLEWPWYSYLSPTIAAIYPTGETKTVSPSSWPTTAALHTIAHPHSSKGRVLTVMSMDAGSNPAVGELPLFAAPHDQVCLCMFQCIPLFDCLCILNREERYSYQ